MRTFLTIALAAALALLAGCSRRTPEQARAFVDKAETELLLASNAANVAQWVQETYITDDTQSISASANEKLIAAQVRLAKEAARFDGLTLPEDVKRKLLLIKLGITLPAPSDPKLNAEVARLAASLDATYGKGKYCPPAPRRSVSASTTLPRSWPPAAIPNSSSMSGRAGTPSRRPCARTTPG